MGCAEVGKVGVGGVGYVRVGLSWDLSTVHRPLSGITLLVLIVSVD